MIRVSKQARILVAMVQILLMFVVFWFISTFCNLYFASFFLNIFETLDCDFNSIYNFNITAKFIDLMEISWKNSLIVCFDSILVELCLERKKCKWEEILLKNINCEARARILKLSSMLEALTIFLHFLKPKDNLYFTRILSFWLNYESI